MSSHILGLGPEVAVFHPEMAFAWKSGLSVKADGMSGNAPGPLTDSTLHKLPLPSSLCSQPPVLADRVECCHSYWHPCEEKRSSWVTIPTTSLMEVRNGGPEEDNEQNPRF